MCWRHVIACSGSLQLLNVNIVLKMHRVLYCRLMFFDQAREAAEREHKTNPADPLVCGHGLGDWR